jgi:hypothetical protein
MATPLALWLLPLCASLAACNAAPAEQEPGEGDQVDAAAGADEDDLEWPCASLEEVEGREVCERYTAHRRPPNSLIDTVEARLASNPCVGALDRWQRLYSFANRRGGTRGSDESRVAFSYRQAGVYGFHAERRVTAPEVWQQVDDRRYDFIIGSFNIDTGKITIDYCGPNVRQPG